MKKVVGAFIGILLAAMGAKAQLAMGGGFKAATTPPRKQLTAPVKSNPAANGALTSDEHARLAEAMKHMTPKERKRLGKAWKHLTPEQQNQVAADVKRQLSSGTKKRPQSLVR